ncbi:MAG: CapA family protein [Bacteroidetes bacterium]|nr:CapA family protein [Bacteroidota bacterium]MCW5896661.1 CapA family protein [Bacteroidota bacterium]
MTNNLRTFRCELLLAMTLLVVASSFPQDNRNVTLSQSVADTIENFESGTVHLNSYPGRDEHPNAWSVDSLLPHAGSRYSLKLWGNTWKIEAIPPCNLDTGSVWQVAAYIDSVGEIQGFGVIDDSSRTLMYCFAGTQQVSPAEWITVYQGAFPIRSWNRYQLPIADDWLARYGRLPTITGLVFINSRPVDPHSVIFFDDIVDITSELPIVPVVSISYSIGSVYANRFGVNSVDVQFFSHVTPDSTAYSFLWNFGDETTSILPNPQHTFVVEDDHPYTVLLKAASPGGMSGSASCRIQVDPGETTFPIMINFVGDIMMARRYEQAGGIIPTQGVQAIFAPTRPYLGDAADITVANLESALTSTGTPHPTKSVVFRSSPANVAGLTYAGIDVVTLANNHVIDYGLAGLQQMQSVLRNSNIVFSGAGADSYEALLPAFYSQSGVCIAFVASSDRTGQYNNEQPFLNAGFNKPGFANLTPCNLRNQIDTVRNIADLVVVEMHSGSEYSFAPSRGIEIDEGADEEYSPFMHSPLPADIQIRQQAIDNGADVVICHHPHILQGFQAYQGKLIAHSLGNFTFDLEYPETMPTAILNAKIDQRGFHDYSVTPAFIDHYIPRRASGEFGLHLLNYLSKRSKDLGTYMIVDSESVTAGIVLDTTLLQPSTISHTSPLSIQQAGAEWVSAPLRLMRSGSISSIERVSPSGSWQYRLGRDVVWFGNFENEGCALWNVGGGEYDSTAYYRGRRSLLQRRAAGSGTATANLEKRILCNSPSSKHSLYGYVKTSNANNAIIRVKYYSSRSGLEIGSTDIGSFVNGTTDWALYHREFAPAANTTFFDIQLTSSSPSSGNGSTWFDDVGIIEWSDWMQVDPSVKSVTPNDYYWVQVKTSSSTTNASITYNETRYSQLTTSVESADVIPSGGFLLLQNYPNPFNSSTTIQYTLSGLSKVRLNIYNILGQQVAQLVGAEQPAGNYRVRWDAAQAATGIYFCRLQTEAGATTKKLLLLK